MEQAKGMHGDAIRRFLQRIRVLRTPVFEESDYLVTVFLMSEGTAQGIPRPLQVFKKPLSYRIEVGGWYVSAEDRVAGEVAHIVRYGYTHVVADGTRVTHPPHTIYKITSKDVTVIE